MHPFDYCRQVTSLTQTAAPRTRKKTGTKRLAKPYGKDIFLAVNDVALPMLESLCRRWLPGGKLQAGEWVALNPTRADNRAGSFKVNVSTGLWADFATDAQGGDPISLRAYLEGMTQIEAARLLAAELGVDA